MQYRVATELSSDQRKSPFPLPFQRRFTVGQPRGTTAMFHQTENDRLNALLDEDQTDAEDADREEILADADNDPLGGTEEHPADLDGVEMDGAEG